VLCEKPITTNIEDAMEICRLAQQKGVKTAVSFSGLFTFMRKLSSALAAFIIANIIALAGYKPPTEKVVEGAI